MFKRIFDDILLNQVKGSGGPPPTFRLLTEASDNIAAENNDLIRTE